MKMSKQERIALLIFLVLLTLGIGVFMFVMPVFNKISANDAILKNKRVELDGYLQKQATKDAMKDEVIAAYEAGRDEADMFFEELCPYEADQVFHDMFEYCRDKGVNVTIDSLTVSDASTRELGVSFLDQESIIYNLKTYATQGVAATQEELDKEAAQLALRSSLNYTQTVGSIDVEFKVYALDANELFEFIDTVNNYIRSENENGEIRQNRKAVLLNGFEVKYPEIEVKTDDDGAAQEITLTVDKDGKIVDSLLDEDETPVYELTTSVSLLSIERMEDPTAQLELQEKQ